MMKGPGGSGCGSACPPHRASPSCSYFLVLLHVQKDSKFVKAYEKGIHKSKYWDPVYEDSMDLLAKLPQLAAMIYRKTYKGGKYINPDPKLDWAANMSHMMGAFGPPPPPAPRVVCTLQSVVRLQLRAKGCRSAPYVMKASQSSHAVSTMCDEGQSVIPGSQHHV